jgi:hypothetical protein
VGESLFAVAWPRLQEGGLERIAAALREGHRLVVIDTFSRACGRADQMDAGEMTMLLGDLQRLALDHHAAIMLVDHHRKSARTSPDTDPIDDIYGSTAKAGVVDCAIGLYRRHNEETATLKLSGRDFGDRELPLRWDAGACRWEALPPEETQRTTLGRGYQAVLDALGALGEASGLQVAQYLEMDRDNTYHRLKELHARGVVARELREGKLVYRLAEQGAPVGAVEAVEAVGAVGEEVG